MTLTSTNDSVSIFEDGKLRPGTYKVQNVCSQTYVDIREHSKELCGRPDTVLKGKGLWEICPWGPGYTIRRLDPGMPEQFCIMLAGLENGSRIAVATFPVPWRIEIVNARDDHEHHHVRIFWGTTNKAWNLTNYGSDEDLTQLVLWENSGPPGSLWELWKLIPVKLDAVSQPVTEATSAQTRGSGPLPPYDGRPSNQRCTYSHQSTETGDDGFGTTVVEVTTTTVTTRKKYRVEGE